MDKKKVLYNALIVGPGEDELHPDIVERERDRLVKFFRIKIETGKTTPTIQTLDDAIESSTRIVNSAIEGYPRASNKGTSEEMFIARINFMSRYSKMPEIWDDNKKPKKRQKKAGVKIDLFTNEDIPEEEEEQQTPAYKETFLKLNRKDEREFFEKRKEFYIKEFEFNDSSDQMLLETVLSDEIILRRLTNKKLNNENVDDDLIDDIQKRYRENLKALGVSRAQRIADDSNQKGNVAQLSESLDAKLEEIRNLSDLGKRDKIVKKLIVNFSLVTLEDVFQAIEELEYTRQRALRPDMENVKPLATINEIPAMVEIDALLKDMNKKELN